MTAQPTEATRTLRAARDFLFTHREDYDGAVAGFCWPRPEQFNWALEWFDVIAAEHPDRAALTIVEQDGSVASYSYGRLSARSDQVAGWLRSLGVRRGDKIILMLDNQVELWEVILAAGKLGAVLIPASTQLRSADLADRVDRGGARVAVARSVDATLFDGLPGQLSRIAVGEPVDGWSDYADSGSYAGGFTPDGPTGARDPLLLYFTSGTTALPKLVEHSHVSYPIGHLTTMYWLGLRPGDVHLNVSSPGWAKHAWSNVFAPWLAQATAFVSHTARFDPVALMQTIDAHRVTTFCAPPTVWRMLLQADLSTCTHPPREVVGAGEPLNPEIIARVRDAWGVTIRDGFGQTETTLTVGNSPGQRLKEGSMGRPMPGLSVTLIDPITGAPGRDGEICIELADDPVPLLTGYAGDTDRTALATAGGRYHTGDVGALDDDGYLTYVGRADDVFKASDYRISPFELESVLLRHEAVAEAAVVPAPDEIRLAVPKAFVVLAAGHPADERTAAALFAHIRATLTSYQRIRRLEFTDLPKTISGKIRRVELRELEAARAAARTGAGRGPDRTGVVEFRIEDFPPPAG